MRRGLTVILSALLCCTAAAGAAAATPEAQRTIDRARSLFDQGRWSDARNEFIRARRLLSSDDRAERQCADCYLAACAVELGSRDAEAALRSFAARYPGSVYNNDVHFALASYYCTRDDFARAAEAFAEVDRSLLSDRQREQYDFRTGYIAFSEGDYDRARELFGRIPAGSSYADHAAYYRAYIDYAGNRNAEAKRAFAALAKSDAYGRLAPYYLLQLEYREGNYRYVVERGEELLRQAAPEHRRELMRVMAESWYHLGDYDRTLDYLNRWLGDGGVMGRDENYLMGFALYRTAQYADAADCLRKACGADDALTQNASYHLADCCLRSGDKQQALHAFAMASNDAFDAAIAEDALFNYGKLQYELGGGVFNEAINVLGRYLDKYPSSERAREARELLIAAYYNSSDYDAAYRAIKAYPQPDGELRAALQKIAYFRGLEAYAAGDAEAAGRYLAESAAVGVSPRYAALAAFWQGEIAYDRKEYAAAAAKYDAYLKRAPRSEAEYALAHYNLGYVRFAQERMPEARELFSRFLALHKEGDRYRADAWNRLGDACYAERDFDGAVEAYDRAAASGQEERFYAQYQRALTLGIQEQYPRKIEALKRIVAAGRGDYLDDAQYELGRTYMAQEQYHSAAAALERFVETYPRSPYRAAALSDLGLVHLNLGDRQKSLKYYDMAVKASPRSTEARSALQGIRDIYVADGNVDAYFAYAEQVGAEGDLSSMARDSLTFASAQRLYLSAQNAEAVQALSGYLKSFPKGYHTIDALYYLSDCYRKSGARQEAIAALDALAALPDNQYTVAVLGQIAEMQTADGRYAEAAAAQRRLGDLAPTAAARSAAIDSYVDLTLRTGDDGAIGSMTEFVETHADAGETALRRARFARAGRMLRSGERAGAMAIYRELGEREVESPEGAASAYYVLEELFRGGDMAQVEEAVYAFADRNTPQAYWLARAYLLLGDSYARRGDAFQARATYQSVADGYSPADDGIVTEAEERIAKLK